MGPDEMAQIDHADDSAPRGKVTVRVGDVMLLLKTLDKVAGLVKNARVKVVSVRWNAVEVALPRASGVETLHTIGRAYFKMTIKPGSPIVIIRKQIPLKHAYAISANKSQGQTMEKVLFDARHPAFSGGQQYVVCSRVRRREGFAAVVGDANLVGGKGAGRRTLVVANVVYTELLDALDACGGGDEDGHDDEHEHGSSAGARSRRKRSRGDGDSNRDADTNSEPEDATSPSDRGSTSFPTQQARGGSRGGSVDDDEMLSEAEDALDEEMLGDEQDAHAYAPPAQCQPCDCEP